ncbi:MAG: Holliday junction resolvase RuvX [Bacilli bacterium]|nr:Holliday junction resolvase RuvX [Bacilli bacterium]
MKKNLLALDLGKGSLGMALSRSGEFISPLNEVRFPAGHYEYGINAIRDLLMIERVETFVLGLPLFPSGDDCEMTPIVNSFANRLNETFPNIELVFQDERNTTVEASALLHESGKKAKKQKKSIDSIAAAVILRRYLVSIGQMD